MMFEKRAIEFSTDESVEYRITEKGLEKLEEYKKGGTVPLRAALVLELLADGEWKTPTQIEKGGLVAYTKPLLEEFYQKGYVERRNSKKKKTKR